MYEGHGDQATTATTLSSLDHSTKHVVNSLNGIDILYLNILPLRFLAPAVEKRVKGPSVLRIQSSRIANAASYNEQKT
jgi:hypothetical protein